jgi:hypothetical protein
LREQDKVKVHDARRLLAALQCVMRGPTCRVDCCQQSLVAVTVHALEAQAGQAKARRRNQLKPAAAVHVAVRSDAVHPVAIQVNSIDVQYSLAIAGVEAIEDIHAAVNSGPL